jgi:hypothetical protein
MVDRRRGHKHLARVPFRTADGKTNGLCYDPTFMPDRTFTLTGQFEDRANAFAPDFC